MARYRNTLTGVVVDIPESLAASIGSYESLDAPAVRDEESTEKRPARRSRKSDD